MNIRNFWVVNVCAWIMQTKYNANNSNKSKIKWIFEKLCISHGDKMINDNCALIDVCCSVWIQMWNAQMYGNLHLGVVTLQLMCVSHSFLFHTNLYMLIGQWRIRTHINYIMLLKMHACASSWFICIGNVHILWLLWWCTHTQLMKA